MTGALHHPFVMSALIRRLAAGLLFAVTTVSVPAQEKPEEASPERARANFARPIVLGPDDVRAFPEPPEGFKTEIAGSSLANPDRATRA